MYGLLYKELQYTKPCHSYPKLFLTVNCPISMMREGELIINKYSFK